MDTYMQAVGVLTRACRVTLRDRENGNLYISTKGDGVYRWVEWDEDGEDHAEGEAADHEHAEDEAADHEHTEGEEHADGASDAGSEEGMPVGAVIAISVAAVAAAGAAATSVIVGQRRRKQAMGGQASPEPTNDSTPEAPSAPNGEDQR